MLVSRVFVENGPNLKKIEGFTVRKEKNKVLNLKNRLMYFFIDSKNR